MGFEKIRFILSSDRSDDIPQETFHVPAHSWLGRWIPAHDAQSQVIHATAQACIAAAKAIAEKRRAEGDATPIDAIELLDHGERVLWSSAQTEA